MVKSLALRRCTLASIGRGTGVPEGATGLPLASAAGRAACRRSDGSTHRELRELGLSWWSGDIGVEFYNDGGAAGRGTTQRTNDARAGASEHRSPALFPLRLPALRTGGGGARISRRQPGDSTQLPRRSLRQSVLRAERVFDRWDLAADPPPRSASILFQPGHSDLDSLWHCARAAAAGHHRLRPAAHSSHARILFLQTDFRLQHFRPAPARAIRQPHAAEGDWELRVVDLRGRTVLLDRAAGNHFPPSPPGTV